MTDIHSASFLSQLKLPWAMLFFFPFWGGAGVVRHNCMWTWTFSTRKVCLIIWIYIFCDSIIRNFFTFFGQLDLGMVSQGKTAVLLDFVQMRGGNPAQIFWHLFISAFLVNKGGYFLQNANNLNFKLFLGCM